MFKNNLFFEIIVMVVVGQTVRKICEGLQNGEIKDQQMFCLAYPSRFFMPFIVIELFYNAVICRKLFYVCFFLIKTYRNLKFLSGKSINFCPFHFFPLFILRNAFYTLKSDKYSPMLSISFPVSSFPISSLIFLESIGRVFLKTLV